jgi:hypothetical protein
MKNLNQMITKVYNQNNLKNLIWEYNKILWNNKIKFLNLKNCRILILMNMKMIYKLNRICLFSYKKTFQNNKFKKFKIKLNKKLNQILEKKLITLQIEKMNLIILLLNLKKKLIYFWINLQKNNKIEKYYIFLF